MTYDHESVGLLSVLLPLVLATGLTACAAGTEHTAPGPASEDAAPSDTDLADTSRADAAPADMAAETDASDGAAAPEDEGGAPVLVAASGNAFDFSMSGGRIEGAEVTVLELPGSVTTTDADGFFRFDDLPAGIDVSFVMSHPGYPPIQTGTLTLEPPGLEGVSFQAPDHALFELLAGFVNVTPDPDRCQMATTVTRIGHSLYDTEPGTHGEPDATVEIAPPVPPEHGPIYFNLVDYNVIFPDKSLEATTDDGGVLFVNVPPGEYTLEAHKEGAVFRGPVRMKCRPGLLVNASPPWGLQVTEGGVGPKQEQ